ncbi:MAG: type II toxin-antitoxin system VapC family toxin [Promethearchaeota archaeon]
MGGALFDTNVVIGILRELPDYIDKYKLLTTKFKSKGLTVYTLSELYEGLEKTKGKRKELQRKLLDLMIEDFKEIAGIFSLTPSQARLHAKLKVNLHAKGNPIPVIDLLIGTIAIDKDLTLITEDKKHFMKLEEIEPTFKVIYW